MKKLGILVLQLFAVIASARPALAGTVYVPLPGVAAVGATGYEAQVTVTNSLAQQRVVNYTLLATNTDGTQRASLAPTPLTVPSKQSILLKPAAGFRGLLELNGPIDFQYSARLVGTGAAAGLGVDLPVISSQAMGVANEKLTVQGLRSGGTRSADLTVVNLGKQAATCTVELVRSNGTSVQATATVSLSPLSHRLFTDIFAGVAAPGLTDARAVVGCSKDFYAFAQMTDSATGEFAMAPAAATGKSILLAPGAQPDCPVGATCLEAKGVVHRPTVADPVGDLVFNAPVGTFKRVKMSLDVTVGDFYPADPDGKHLIYWFVINRNFDMLGMLYFRGPATYTAIARHGIGLSHGDKVKLLDKNFRAQPGRTYHCENDYDPGSGKFTITITDKDTGEVKSVLRGVPNVTQVTLKAGDHLMIDLAFPENKVPDEVPAYGWLFSDVRIELTPR